jgi:hypothetical protein
MHCTLSIHLLWNGKNAYDGLEQPFTFPKQAIPKQSLMNLDRAILTMASGSI